MKLGLPIQVVLVIGLLIIVTAEANNADMIPWYGIAVLVLVFLPRLVLSRRNPTYAAAVPGKTAVVVPVYNEDPETLRSVLNSIAALDPAPDEVWIIDDGSTSDDISRVVNDWRATVALPRRLPVTFLRFDTNRGKRHAQALAFSVSDADIFVTIDSDTVVDSRALMEVCGPLADPEVMAVTGHTRASNFRSTLLSRLIDVRYANSFLWDRASYSALGSVLCCCGSLSAYRASVVREHLSDFTNQTFLGVKCTYGDDRRLTNYALLHGKVVFQSSARAWTTVPERMGHFLRQQIRWNKSFFRESWWGSQHLPMRTPAVWLVLLELATWMVFTTSLFTVIGATIARGDGEALMDYAYYLISIAYIRSVYYLDDLTMSLGDRITGFIFAPWYGLLHVFVLLPLRLWSLVTLRDNRWGTRSKVEVAA